MANRDAPNGFTPAYHLTGGQIRAKEYRIADDYNTLITTGDMVKLVAGGTIEVAGAGDRVVGVFSGCRVTKDNGEVVWSKHWPASQSVSGSYAFAMVYDDPNIVFRAQCDDVTGVADIGQLTDIVATAGSATTGLSNQEVDATTGAVTAQLRILDFVDDPTNDSTLTNAEVYVQIYEHEYNEHVAGGAASASPGV